MNKLLVFIAVFVFSVMSAEAGMPIGKGLYTEINLMQDTTATQSLVVRKPCYLFHGKLDAKYAAEGLKYGAYIPIKELEMHSVPLLAFGFIAKGTKQNFRSARNEFIPSYKNRLDDVIQLAPFMLSTGLNLGNYEGRSDFLRYIVSSAASFGMMAVFVNGIKYTAKEMRPDGSSANSFPSGHTATAFTAATILHKEYGLTRSPWWSVLGYSVATTTGIMRTLNNRHWISDVLVGAGIGVLSTDLGYMIGDLIFKNKHLNREPKDGNENMLEHPSFFRFSLGMQFTNDITLPSSDIDYTTSYPVFSRPGATELEADFLEVKRHGIPDNFDVDPSKRTYNNYANTLPGNEKGSLIYKNPRLKVGTGTTVSAEAAYFFTNYVGAGVRARITTAPVAAEGLSSYDFDMKLLQSESVTDVWSMADVGLGVYVAWPINAHHNINVKAMYGRRFFGSLVLQAAYDTGYHFSEDENESVSILGDALSVEKSSADNISTGLTYTYSMGNGVAIAAFCEVDRSKPLFKVEYAPYNDNAATMLQTRSQFQYNNEVKSFTVGASMTVLF